MELSALLHSLSKYKTPLVLLCLSAVVNTVLLTYVIAEKFESSALVLVRPQEDLKITSAGQRKEVLDFPLPQVIPFEAMTRTYAEVIKSRAVAEQVVRILHLDEDRGETGWWKRAKKTAAKFAGDVWALLKYGKIPPEDPFERAVENVEDYISVEPKKDSYVFQITYEATDPQQAAAVVNTAAEVFVAYHQEVYKAEATKAREFVEAELRQSEQRLADARRQLQEFKESNEVTLLDEELSTKIDALTTLESSVAKQEVELSGLSQRLAPAHPQILELQAAIDLAKRKVEAQQAELLRYPAKEHELAKLTLELAVAEDTHKFLTHSYDDARIREAEQIREIAIVSPGVAPAHASRPIKIYYALVALVMAAVVGVVAVLLRDTMDPRIRNIEGAERALELPVLATIPSL